MAWKDTFSSQHSIASPDGAYIATLQVSSLAICSCIGATLQTITLPQEFVSKCRFIRWSCISRTTKEEPQEEADGGGSPCSRILLADDDTVRIYDVNDKRWSATIEKTASNFGKIADAAFGHVPNEVLVFSDFGVKLTIWSLMTCRGVEIRDPKYMVQCYSIRPRTGHLAILTRPAAQDILMILNPGDQSLYKSVELPTLDAQEVAWSPDSCWLAIRDTASSGHKVLIYTADGHLFRTYTGDEDAGDIGLGVKRMQWNSCNGSLVLGDYNDNVTILSKNVFSPLAILNHPATIQMHQVQIWEEQLDATGARSYIAAPQPASPPSSISLTKSNNPTHGISIIATNMDGTMIAIKDDFVPTTIWIWSMKSGKAVAVLIHHSPVKHVAWHDQQSDSLLIHCAIPEPVVHLWKSTWDAPRVVTLQLERTGERLEASWLKSSEDDTYGILLSSTHRYTRACLFSNGEVMPELPSSSGAAISIRSGVEDMFDEGNSLDLSPIKLAHDETFEVHERLEGANNHSGSSFGMANEMVDDTFHYRRHVKAAG